MKQYGLRLRRPKSKDGESVLEVYHLSLSYMDWAVYSGSDELFDPSTVRYMIHQYVIKVVDNGQEVPVDFIMSEPTVIIEKIISSIVSKSIFTDDAQIESIMDSLRKKSKTLAGSYDLFVYLHGGPDLYLRMLEQDAYTRAQVIMMLELGTGITVKERFDRAVKDKIALDLVSDPSTYERNLRKHGGPVPRRPQRLSPLDEHNRSNMMEDGTGNKFRRAAGQAEVPSKVNEMLDESRSALAQALDAGRRKQAKNPEARPVFNWNQDQSMIDQMAEE